MNCFLIFKISWKYSTHTEALNAYLINSSNLNLQVLVKVYNLLIDEETRTFYDYGGLPDNKGRKILLNIEPRPNKGKKDRDIYMSLYMDSHGSDRHHFQMNVQRSFADQPR